MLSIILLANRFTTMEEKKMENNGTMQKGQSKKRPSVCCLWTFYMKTKASLTSQQQHNLDLNA